jgi:hypothetical protein
MFAERGSQRYDFRFYPHAKDFEQKRSMSRQKFKNMVEKIQTSLMVACENIIRLRNEAHEPQ